MRSPAGSSGGAGALMVLALLAAVVAVSARVTPRSRQLPLHLLSVAAALRDVEATLAREADQLDSEADQLASEADQLVSGADQLDSEAAALSRQTGALSRQTGALSRQTGALSRQGEEETPLERPPLLGRLALDSAAAGFAEYSGRTLRPRRSKGRRRGGLRLSGEQHLLWLHSGECRKTTNGEERFFCPSLDSGGGWRCITADSLCDRKRDCPGGEDEDGTSCLFYNAISDRLSSMTNHVLKLKEHHRRQ